MDIAMTVVGAVIVLVVLRDVFHTLFHPGGDGALSAHVCTAVWAVARRLGRRPQVLAGPLAVTTTMLVWFALLVVGFALVYLPQLPQDASYGPGIPKGGGVEDAVYLSVVALATLGLGDVVLAEPWMRLVTPLEALFGFAVLTGAIGWISQIYPALARRRSLALEVGCGAAGDTVLPGPGRAAQLRAWTSSMSAVVVDLVQNSETYYFREHDPRIALVPLLVRLDQVVQEESGSTDDEVAAAARGLDRVLGIALEVLHEQFGAPGDRVQALRELADAEPADD